MPKKRVDTAESKIRRKTRMEVSYLGSLGIGGMTTSQATSQLPQTAQVTDKPGSAHSEQGCLPRCLPRRPEQNGL